MSEGEDNGHWTRLGCISGDQYMALAESEDTMAGRVRGWSERPPPTDATRIDCLRSALVLAQDAIAQRDAEIARLHGLLGKALAAHQRAIAVATKPVEFPLNAMRYSR